LTRGVFADDDDFDAAEVAEVVPKPALAGDLVGDIRYHGPNGEVVTIEFATDSPNNDCQAWGTAIAS